MKRILSTLFFIIFFTQVFSQQYYYKKGFIITSNGDILNGYIERLSESKISLEINFLQELGDHDPVVYKPNEVRKFCFIDDSIYFCLVEYSFYREGEKFTFHRFAKQLNSGEISLFKLQLSEEEQNIILEKNNTYVYIVRINSIDYVLRQTEKLLEDNYYKLDKEYTKVLKYLFNDCPEIIIKIENVKFDDEAIVSIIVDYSSCKGYKVDTDNYKVKLTYYHALQFSCNFVMKSEISHHLGYTIGYSFGYIKPDLSENISFSFGIEFFHMNEPLQLYHSLQSANLPEISTRTNFIRMPMYTTIKLFKSNVSPFIKGGVVPVISKEYLHLDALYGIGIEFKKFDLSVNLSCEDVIPIEPITSMITLKYHINGD